MANMRRLIGIQYCTTGAFGYSFREDGTEWCNIGCLSLLNPDISVSGSGQELWHRDYDRDMTLVPGVRRNFIDQSGYVRGYYTYTGQNKFDITTENELAHVEGNDHGWRVFKAGKLVALVHHLPQSERTQFEENGFDMETRFLIDILDTVDVLFYPYIMAIPVLAFMG